MDGAIVQQQSSRGHSEISANPTLAAMKMSPRYRYAVTSTAVATLTLGLLVGPQRLRGRWLGLAVSLVAVFFLARHLYGKID